MKTIKIGELNVKVCENQGDILYTRFVKFKQYAPQFWEKMDSPLFAVYYEKFKDFHSNNQHADALITLQDYKIALDNSKNSYDAWGICFALITEVIDGGENERFKTLPDDADIKAKLDLFNKNGLTAETVKSEVLAFMAASPEVFADHLTLYAIQSTMNGIDV